MRLVIDFNRGEQPPANLIVALQAAHARDHELVQQLQHAQQTLIEGRAALDQQNELLRTRTIERDHHAQDAHLWACIIAYLVQQEELESLPLDDVNAMNDVMLSADVRDGHVFLSIADRPAASEEGKGG